MLEAAILVCFGSCRLGGGADLMVNHVKANLKATLLLEVKLEFNRYTLTIDASKLVIYLR